MLQGEPVPASSMMNDLACFSSAERLTVEDMTSAIRPGKRLLMVAYQTQIAAGKCWLITITWCKNLLLHGLFVSIQEKDNENYQCKVELKPWYFWKKQGSKLLNIDGRVVEVAWDLRTAKFSGETEPLSDYFVAIVCEKEVVLVVGDLKKEAFRKTGCRPSLIDPILVSRKEHVFGRRKFSTRAKFEEKGNFHELSIECNNDSSGNKNSLELEIKIDGDLAVHVKHLQWKFRGNQTICVCKTKLEMEVYWDVHDWLFNSGARHGLFIFRPISPATSSPSASLSDEVGLGHSALMGEKGNDSSSLSSFCLVFYAWRTE